MVSITRPERFRFARLKRNHIALTTIALLLVLDLGRSINARVGYATPVSGWQPSPSGSDVAPRSGPAAQHTPGRTYLCAEMCRLPRT
jgi:hypothetical protein